MAGVKGRSGGARPGAGRKPLTDEQALKDKLYTIEGLAIEKLKAGIETGDFRFIKYFFDRLYGRAPQTVVTEDVTEKRDPIADMTDEEIRSQTDRLMVFQLQDPNSRFHKAIRDIYGITEKKWLSHADVPERENGEL